MPKAVRIVPSVDEISLAFDPANMKEFMMHKDQSYVRTPSFCGVESLPWKDVDVSLEAFCKACGHTGDMSQLTKDWITERTLLGDAKADSEEDLIFFPVVNPKTNKLNEDALRMLLGDGGVTARISAAALESVRGKVQALLKDNFGAKRKRDHEVAIWTRLANALRNKSKKGDLKMDKKAMIKSLVEDKEYPFTKENQEWLEGQDEKVLGILMKMKIQPEVDEGKIREDIRKDLEPQIRAELKKELEKDGKTVITELKDELTALKKEVTGTKDALKKANDKIEAAEDKTAEMEFVNFVKENTIPGDVKEIVKTMLLMSKMSPEMLKTYKGTLKAAGDAIVAAGAFSEIGAEGDGAIVKDNAYIKLQAKKVELMNKDTDLSETKAWRAAIKENPELYKEYMKETKR